MNFLCVFGFLIGLFVKTNLHTRAKGLIMKYIVGYPIKENKAFLSDIINSKDSISEVYFSWGDLPNGRSALSTDEAQTSFEIQQRQASDLKLLSSEGVKLNMLFNANCYGKDSQSRAFFYKIGNLIDYIQREFGLSSVTTGSPLIAKFVKENFEGIDVRASVNMEIGSIEGISYVSGFFDSFYVKRELNRNLPMLLKLRRWCDDNGKQMYLLANSGCLNNCSAHIFHDNLVAHEAEISAMDNGYQFRGVCWDFLSDKQNLEKWLQRTNFIRPEDIELYDDITAMKLGEEPTSDVIAVRMMLGEEAAYDSKIVGALVDSIKILYPGTCVELTNGYTGLVIKKNREDVLRPIVLSFVDNNLYNLEEDEIFSVIQIRDIMKTMDKRVKIDKETIETYLKQYN